MSPPRRSNRANAFASAALSGPGSLKRGDNLAVSFVVTDGNASLPVRYQGILPDLFREGQGVISEGALDEAGTFKADNVLASITKPICPRKLPTR